MSIRLLRPRGEMDIIQVSGTWGPGSIPGEGMVVLSTERTSQFESLLPSDFRYESGHYTSHSKA